LISSRKRDWWTILIYFAFYCVKQKKRPASQIIWRLISGQLNTELEEEARQQTSEFYRSWLPRRYLLRVKFISYQSLTAIYKRILQFRSAEMCRHDHQSTRGPKALVIRTGALGDVIMSTALIAELHDRHAGDIQIDVATNFPEVFYKNPRVRSAQPIKETQSLKVHYDLILDLDNVYEQFHDQHPVRTYSRYLFGRPVERQLELYNSNGDLSSAIKKLGELTEGKDINLFDYVVLHSRYEHSQRFRGVEPSSWRRFVRDVFVNAPRQTLIYVGSADLDECSLIDAHDVLDARSRLTLAETTALIDHAKVFIGTDAGPLHIAAATKTPIVSFFTHVPSNCREPLGRGKVPFVAIEPDLECKGCTARQPFPFGFECKLGEPICSGSFGIERAVKLTRELLKLG